MAFAFSGFFLLVALVIWAVFLRPVPEHTNRGIVISRTYKPAGHDVLYHAGDRKNFRLPVYIPRAAGYLIEVQLLPEQSRTVVTLVNENLAANLIEGSAVEVKYQLRSIPGLWQRAYVTSIRAIVGKEAAN